jgi:hypothetical protein
MGVHGGSPSPLGCGLPAARLTPDWSGSCNKWTVPLACPPGNRFALAARRFVPPLRRAVSASPLGIPPAARACGVLPSEGTGAGVDRRLPGRDHRPVQRGRDYECAATARELPHVGLTVGQVAEHRLRVVGDIPALLADADVRHAATVSDSSFLPGRHPTPNPTRGPASPGANSPPATGGEPGYASPERRRPPASPSRCRLANGRPVQWPATQRRWRRVISRADTRGRT